MRDLTYFVAVSLDGRIAGPDGDFSAFPTSGDHLDAIVRDWTDTLPAAAHAALGVTPDRSRFDSVLMGWNTYEVGFAYGVRDPYPHLEQYVVTRDHRNEPVPEGICLVDDPLALIQRLKQAEGAGIWLCGGGQLATSVADEIDRLVLKVNPLLLGDGRPLFAGAYRPREFQLERSTAFQSGVVINEYERTA